MHLLDFAILASWVITVASILLAGVILSLRIATQMQLSREHDHARLLRSLIPGFLSDAFPTAEITPFLQKSPRNSLRFLMEESATLGSEMARHLRPLFAAFPWYGQALLALKNHSWRARLLAAEQLGFLGNVEAAPNLREALHDRVLAVRFAAAEALVQIGDAASLPAILQALEVPGEVSQRRVTDLLAKLGQSAVPPLLSIFDSTPKDPAFLSIPIRLTGVLRVEDATSHLLRFLALKSPNIRLNAVRSLASIGDPVSISPIAALVEDPSWEVRSAVMLALGRLQAVDRIPELLGGLSDPQWWVRHNAGLALTSLGEAGMVALKRATTDHPDAYGRELSLSLLQQHDLANDRKKEAS